MLLKGVGYLNIRKRSIHFHILKNKLKAQEEAHFCEETLDFLDDTGYK